MVPIIINYLSVWTEIELFQAFWDVERDPSSPKPQPASPVPRKVTQDEDIDVGDELTVHKTKFYPGGSRFRLVEAP